MTDIQGFAVATAARGATTVTPHTVYRRPFYIGTSVLMTVIAAVGFWLLPTLKNRRNLNRSTATCRA